MKHCSREEQYSMKEKKLILLLLTSLSEPIIRVCTELLPYRWDYIQTRKAPFNDHALKYDKFAFS